MQSKVRSSSIKKSTLLKQEGIYSQSFEIIPSEVVFKDIEVNQYYEITVEIRNLTTRSKRIRFQKPENPNFLVIYNMQPEIASGLSMTAKIKYQCKELKNQTQIIKVISEDGLVVELPVRVYKMESQIMFQPFIDMGFLKIGKQHEEKIAIKNNGKAVGSIEFSHQHGPILVVQPKVLKISPQQQTFIRVKYKPTEAGIFKGSIKLKSQAILVKDSIDIHATSVDHSRYIIDDKNNQTNSFDFGTMFVGEESVIKAFVVNNSPKQMSFKTVFRKGYLVSAEQFVNVQTPSEIGHEQSERVMFMTPQYATIDPFQELEVRFYCRTKVNYRDQVFTKSYALTPLDQEGAINHKKNSNQFKPENIYQYSIMLSSQGDDPIVMQLKANAICPQVKLQKDLLKFGDCAVKDSRELTFTLQNKNPVSRIDISFQKIPNFSVVPVMSSLKPNESGIYKVIFEPKTIGKIDSIQKLYINKIYDIDIRCFGIATTEQSKSRKRIQSIKESPQLSQTQKDKDFKARSKAFSVAQKTFISQMRKSTQEAELIKLQLQTLRDNKDKYNKFLIERRTDRMDKQKDQTLQKKWSLYQTKLHDLGAGGKYEEKVDEEGVPTNSPIDYQFETGMIDTKIKRQIIPIPSSKQRLFVTKHIANYEPLPISHGASQKFVKNVLEAPKKVFNETPANFNHKREVASQLTPQQLACIEVATNTINFGQVYTKSKEFRYFWIKNGTKKAITACLKIDNPQLSASYKKNQVIQSGDQAGFQLVFCKDTLGDFKASIKYLINNQHEFEMTVTAKSVPVQIDIDKTNLKFEFEPNSLQMTTSQNITLYNSGNSNAFFKFILNKQRLFSPKILDGTLKSKERISIPIVLTVPTPTTKKNQYNYTQRIIMKVLDGNQITITCNYSLVDPKYNVKCEIFNQSPILCLKHQLEQFLQIKNTSKVATIFHIEGKGIIINEKLKLNPEEVKKLKVRFIGQSIGKFNCSITISPRGGQKKVLENVINVIEPSIQFSHEMLDMGVLVVHGIAGIGNFTLTNKSPIELPLIIDIRSKKIKSQNPQFIENLKLELIDEVEKLQVLGMTQKTEQNIYEVANQGENLVGIEINQDEFDNSESDDENIPQKNEDEQRRYRLLLKPEKVYKFNVEFFPKQAGNFQIEIPMSIEKSIKIQNIPYIRCESINPQFLFEPSVIDFKRKIVTKPDRCYPKFITVNISNIDEEDVNWFLKDQQIKKEGIFQIQVNKGILKSKERLQFKVSFNPYTVGQYNHKIPLFITSSKVKEPLKYVDVILKGTSSLPMLYFNKRQVIMPVVPLDIETTSSFRVLNDGYQNCNLKCQFLDDVANINVKLSFPQGLNIGITKQKIRVDLTWKFNKPISFCLKLQFTDDMNRTFSIPVSGTADNCIFTNYTYFLRNQNKFSIKTQNTLQLVETPEVQPPPGTLQRKNSAHSLKSNLTNKSVFSYLGIAPISPAILANTIDYINRYLNSNLLTIPITNFPGSFIQNDGEPLFEILNFVSSKNTNFPWRFTGNQKGLPKVLKLFEQYNELIKMLKIEGAHLNHIRPEYLLSFSDLNMYLGNLPPQKSKFYMPSLLKINSGLFNYLSMESWITLLYQIFKIYVLARVIVKNFKQHLPTLPDIPAHYLSQSNFCSISENILFFWAEQAVGEVLLQERRLTNFDKDFRDGTVIGSLIQKYANVPVLKKMKMICASQQDYKENANVLCQHLAEIGLQNHISPKDIFHPLQREMLLFILHLYVYLPFYTPKQEPIIFKCILGQQVTRTIELTNPSGKPVNYMVKYEGCEDFKLVSTESFRIEPKQTYKFEVRFVSRLSTPVKGRIMFINVKEKSLTAAALVFQLKSQITGRVSDRIWNVSGLLYEQIQFPIEVNNKFSSAELVDFIITYQTEYIFDSKYLKSKNPIPPLSKDQQIQTIYGKAENIKLRKNGSGTLILNYIPMSMFTTKTTIFFVNNVVGQFQHQIIASVEPPAITAQIRPPMTLSVDQMINWEYQINPKNDMISRAKKAIEGMKKNKKGTTANKQVSKTNADMYISENYNVEIGSNPYFSSKQTILISDKPNNQKAKQSVSQPKKKESIKAQIDTNSENKIPFTIVCKNPVYEFSSYILVSNRSKTDVRRYRVIFTIQPKPLKAILEMNVPARSEVTQNLPIVNNTERDWIIKITWMPDPAKNGNYFIINTAYASAFPVKKNSVGNFPITFKPKWANAAQAKLIMNNPLTLDNFEYQIIGNGEQPLAEQHIQIKCEAKQIVKRQIIVKNPYQQRPINLKVQTDLLNCESVKRLTIPSGGKQKFQFVVQPMLCGQYTGSITFTEQQGPQYIWYTVSIITNYPVALKTMNLQTEIRKKHIQKLQIPYSGTTDNSYQVIINGLGLNGYPSIQLKPNAVNTYDLEYLPLEVGVQKGSICFINPEIGQILYEFNLRCFPKPPVIINNIKSPLGVSTIIYADLENPTNSKANIRVINTNPEQFALKNNIIKLNPYETKSIEIQYIPASLDNVQNAHVKFDSKEIGDWQYQLSGMGLSPVPFNPLIVYNGLLEEHSDSVKFRNPFKYDITVGVKILFNSAADEKVFRLLNTTKSKFEIESFSILQIPFSFIPSSCRMYECKILVMISQKIFWTFPIKGITEINEGKVIANLSTQCRTTTSQYVQIPLEGIQNYKQNNLYEFKLENVPANYQHLIDKFLIIDSPKKSLNHAKDSLEFQFLFKPMKPGKVSCDFLVTRQEGSRWRFKINLEGTEPEPDDFIQIQSSLLVTSTISFKMTNTDKAAAQFKAKFTSDSAHQFSVDPKEGQLAKFGSKGTNFYVSFTPVEYGKQKKGKLVIETAQMYWSYLLKGSLPKYVPPSKPQVSRGRITSQKK